MIRITAKLFVFTLFITTLFLVGPLFAASVVWISSTGNDANPCTAALPCASFSQGVFEVASGGQVNCVNSPGSSETGFSLTKSVTIDCVGVDQVTLSSFGAFRITGNNQVVKIRNLTISGTSGGYPAIKVEGNGTLIIENCVFENFSSGIPLDIEPNGAFNLVVTNSRISNSTGGVLIKPTAGGSVTATFDHVIIADNFGGGLKTDTTATTGQIKVNISDSTITNNTGNGLNAVSGTSGGANMLNFSHSVVASNGTAGIQANGANAAALVDSTLLDSNATGATSAINGGRVLTYGDNRIVGIAGSGFTGPAPLQ